MDMKKLCDILTSRPDIKDIPLSYVFRVAFAVFDSINNGKCFFDSEEEECLSNTTQTLHH